MVNKGHNYDRNEDITIAFHCSTEKVHNYDKQVDNDGPLSLNFNL